MKLLPLISHRFGSTSPEPTPEVEDLDQNYPVSDAILVKIWIGRKSDFDPDTDSDPEYPDRRMPVYISWRMG